MRKILATLMILGLLAGVANAAASSAWVNVTGANTPAGYTSWDLMVTTGTNLAVQEMIIQASAPSDIYQDAFGAVFPASNPAFFGVFPSLEFDTYITLGPYPGLTGGIIGAAVDIQALPSRTETFNDQLLDIAWGPSGGTNSGPGTFVVARVTLANTAQGTWQWKGWETGTQGSVSLAGPIQDGAPIPEPATMLVLLGGALAGLLRRG